MGGKRPFPRPPGRFPSFPALRRTWTSVGAKNQCPIQRDRVNRGGIGACPFTRTSLGRQPRRIHIPRRPAPISDGGGAAEGVSPGRRGDGSEIRTRDARGRAPSRHRARRSRWKFTFFQQKRVSLTHTDLRRAKEEGASPAHYPEIKAGQAGPCRAIWRHEHSKPDQTGSV